MKSSVYLDTPIGRIYIAEENSAVTNLSFQPIDGVVLNETSLLKAAVMQLESYFDGSRLSFDLPLSPMGTAFQRSCWQQLLTIPYGETRTYSQIAALMENPKAQRAVGMANNKNPIAILIPCHRVIGQNGKLVGYAGGLNVKEKLLELEKKYR